MELLSAPVIIEEKIAYVIKDANLPDLPVRESDVTKQGWWMQEDKVKDLLKCFKRGFNNLEACVYIGISPAQYFYFTTKHPEFKEVREACYACFRIYLKDKIYQKLDDPAMLRWVAQHFMKDEFGDNITDRLKPSQEEARTNQNVILINDSTVNISEKTMRLLEKEKNEHNSKLQ